MDVDMTDATEQRMRTIMQRTGADVNMDDGEDIAYVSGIVDVALTDEQRTNGERGYTASEWKKLTSSDRGARRFPLKVDHDKVVGRLLHTFVDDEKNLCISALVDRRTPEGRAAWERVRRGDLDCFSVGFNAYPHSQYGVTDRKLYNLMLEVSMTKNPKKPHAVMKVRCSQSPDGATPADAAVQTDASTATADAITNDTADKAPPIKTAEEIWDEEEIDAELHAAIEAAARKRAAKRRAAAGLPPAPDQNQNQNSASADAPPAEVIPPALQDMILNTEPAKPVPERTADIVLEGNVANNDIIPKIATMADQTASAPMAVDPTLAPVMTPTPAAAAAAPAATQQQQSQQSGESAMTLTPDVIKMLVAEAEAAKALRAQLDKANEKAGRWDEAEAARVAAEQEAQRKIQEERTKKVSAVYERLPQDSNLQNSLFIEAMKAAAGNDQTAAIAETTTSVMQWALEQRDLALKAAEQTKALEQQLKLFGSLLPSSLSTSAPATSSAQRTKTEESTDSSKAPEAQRANGKKAEQAPAFDPWSQLDMKKLYEQAGAAVQKPAAAPAKQQASVPAPAPQQQQQQQQQQPDATEQMTAFFDKMKQDYLARMGIEVPAAASNDQEMESDEPMIDEDEVKWSAAVKLQDAAEAFLGLHKRGKLPRTAEVRNSNASMDLEKANALTWFSNCPTDQASAVSRLMFDDKFSTQIREISSNPTEMMRLMEEANYKQRLIDQARAAQYGDNQPRQPFEYDVRPIPVHTPERPQWGFLANKDGNGPTYMRDQIAGQQIIMYQQGAGKPVFGF